MAKNNFISNKVLIVLFIVAFAVATLGTLVSTESFIGSNFIRNTLTGAISDTTATGQVNISISAVTSLSNKNAKISFGSGRVNSTCDYCIMDSNFINISYFSDNTKSTGRLPFHGADTAGGSCCVSFSGNQSGFLIENTGNTNVSVGYQCTGNCTFPYFIGGTRQAAMAGLEIKVTPNFIAGQTGESGNTDTAHSCTGLSPGGGSGGAYLAYNISGWNISNATDWGIGDGARTNAGVGNSSIEVDGGNFYIMLGGVYVNGVHAGENNVSSGGHWLCGNRTHYPLSSDNDFDAAVVDINVTIPSDSSISGSGGSVLTITFNGTSGAGA